MRKLVLPVIFILCLGNLFHAAHGTTAARQPGVWGLESGGQATSASGGFTLIFPQTANGTGDGIAIRSTVILINNTDRTSGGSLRFHGDDGTPMMLNTSLGTGNGFDFTLGAGEVLRLETDGWGSMQKGWAQVSSDAELSGSGSFVITGSDGTFISEVGIGDSPPAMSQMILAEASGGRYSGFALCNPDPSGTAHLLLELRSLEGSLVATKMLLLGPLEHRAEYVTETFSQANLQDFTGTLAVTSDLPVSLITLRTYGLNYTSFPSVPAPAVGQPARDLVFPRIGDGLFADSRYQTTFFALNNSDESRTAILELFKSNGAEMTVTIGGKTASRFLLTVPGHGAAEWLTDGKSNPGIVGWARIRCDAPLGGGASFSISDRNTGAFISEVGVSGSSTAEKHLLYVRETGGSYTGLALNNTSGAEVTARLRLYAGFNSSGRISVAGSQTRAQSPVAERNMILATGSSLGQFVFELFQQVPEIAANNFEGSLEVSTWLSRFGEDILSPTASLTLFSHGKKFTSAPSAPYRPDSRPLSAFDPRVDELLAKMTLDEKIGQMTQAERESMKEGDIETYCLGSVLSGGGSGPAVNTAESWADMYDGFQSHALNTRLKIPLLYGIDAVHGHSNVRGAVIFPHNIGLGATRNPDLVRMAARITASEVRATGMNWTFSPVVAVPRDERWGRTYEGFGEDPDLVRKMGLAAVSGFQGASLSDPSSIVACAKHYLGDGGTQWGTGSPIDQGDTRVDEATLRRVHLPGYLSALQAGAGTIMVSFSSWNGQKMTGNHYLLTDVLKGELGFMGFLVSDWAAIDQLPGGTYRSQVKTAINAGIDMGMIPYRHAEFFKTLKSLAQAGEVPLSRIDDAVRRILRVKFAAGLFDKSPLTDRSYQNRFGSREHRELAREAVRQSLVLLKNQNLLLPLSKSARRIFVAGSKANDIGSQCGGWTIFWQGAMGEITTGTTILQAIRQSVSSDTQVTYSLDGTGAGGADVGIVVIGESPYAEGLGDSATLALSSQDYALIDNVKSTGIPMVVILISGRPLILDRILDSADAFIAAWLPGTEGEGVADVIFGDYNPTGKLPCSWPRSLDQVPINIGDAAYDPLFPYGFGLSY